MSKESLHIVTLEVTRGEGLIVEIWGLSCRKPNNNNNKKNPLRSFFEID